MKSKEYFLNEKRNAKIRKWFHACKGYANTYSVKVLNSVNPELQLKDNEYASTNTLLDLLNKPKTFKFVTTLNLEFQKIESDDKRIKITFNSNSKAKTIINERDIDTVFESIYSAIISDIQKSLGQGSDWIINSVIDHKYKPLSGNIYTKLPNELDNPKK